MKYDQSYGYTKADDGYSAGRSGDGDTGRRPIKVELQSEYARKFAMNSKTSFLNSRSNS